MSGVDYVLDLLGFDRLLAEADLVITGEGRLDEQSMAGKVVGVVAGRCRVAGVPCFAVVGQSALDEDEAAAIGLAEVLEASAAAEPRAAGRRIVGSCSLWTPRFHKEQPALDQLSSTLKSTAASRR